ncbi:tRNA modification GTPase [Xenorhabdus bovienii]|uniref:tRNA modification GTPase n=1 Tax=Xenorhabdus bovienii TaxID=40576 RepID=UPI0023B2612A|nr:tRNA modification GTPase [Xenorhabdus bovienii]MDE9495664.1 tRNA modification GTPase [Xenorhabdus bovienii]MDE9504069.1 tRNA modification GTPase [Xenorhabdus bovienii]MDE9527823.1 tRNA modification GTPase [Xenorhabdus bovienii]MDE9570997.1 tRNA modification GTPase [Xenorhabdus bovienii]MDE9590004.1 tRNA modification GTPase [Xenorhabdus bovienii]
MSDEIKQIAALIGHQQAQEKRVAALIDEFQKESAQLSRQTAQLAQVISELDSASGNMTETVRKSVSTALTQVERELKQAGLEQQKPAVNALNQVVKVAQESVYAMRREMSRYTWKSAIYIVLTMLAVMGGCLWGMVYFIDSGYARIAEMQKMEAVWQKKAPLADISTCDGKPCVKVDTSRSYGDKKDTYLIFKK